jgi:hypothetical protein
MGPAEILPDLNERTYSGLSIDPLVALLSEVF